MTYAYLVGSPIPDNAKVVPVYHAAIAQTLIPGGNLAAALPTAGTQIEVLSGSANDDTGGTGAINVRVTGLDYTGREIAETFVLNGTAAVASLSSAWWRVTGMHVLSAGSGLKNAGLITAQIVSAGATLMSIVAGLNAAAPGQYTVPRGKKAKFIGGYIGSGNAQANALTLYVKAEVDIETGLYLPTIFNTISFANTAREHFLPESSIWLPELCTARIEAIASAGTLAIGGALRFIEEDAD